MTATSAASPANPSTSREECCVPAPVDSLVPPPDDETLAAMAKAVAHPARLAILQLLTHRETCATGDVVAELPLAQSTVSEHLRILPRGRADPRRDRRATNPLLRRRHRPRDPQGRHQRTLTDGRCRRQCVGVSRSDGS